MEILGYDQKDIEKNRLLVMQEVCFQVSLEEIDELILFLQHVKERHQGVSDIAYCPHTHYSDWRGDMVNIKPDVIISTLFSQNEQKHLSERD